MTILEAGHKWRDWLLGCFCAPVEEAICFCTRLDEFLAEPNDPAREPPLLGLSTRWGGAHNLDNLEGGGDGGGEEGGRGILNI